MNEKKLLNVQEIWAGYLSQCMSTIKI